MLVVNGWTQAVVIEIKLARDTEARRAVDDPGRTTQKLGGGKVPNTCGHPMRGGRSGLEAHHLRRRSAMPKYMFKASLTGEGIAGVMKEGGTARHAVIRDSVERLGGTLEGFYFAFGPDDVIIICDPADDETAAGFAMETSSSGRVAVATTVLLTPEQIDRAREKHSGWRAP